MKTCALITMDLMFRLIFHEQKIRSSYPYRAEYWMKLNNPKLTGILVKFLGSR
jgi:hypothetical protein